MTNWKEMHLDFTKELQIEWDVRGFNYEEVKEWINIGLTPQDYNFTTYLFNNKYEPKSLNNYVLEELREEYYNKSLRSQEWLDKNYPTSEAQTNCKFLNIGVKKKYNPYGIVEEFSESPLSLKGFTNLEVLVCMYQNITDLDLTDCTNLAELFCDFNQLISLDLSSCSKLEMLRCSENQLTELNVNICSNLIELDCRINKLTNLDLTNCPRLTNIICYENQLTQLNLPPKIPSLERLNCRDNLLTNLDFTALNGEKLTVLSLSNNNFFSQDLSDLTKFTNLKELFLSNDDRIKINQGIYNHFIGPLQPLQGMKQLQVLDIRNTDLSGAKYLPNSIVEINCSYLDRPNSGVKLITKELEQNSNFILVEHFNQTYLKRQLDPELFNQIKHFNHQELTSEQEFLLANLIFSKVWIKNYKKNGLCANCQWLSGDSKWCQPCGNPQLQANFANWTSGNFEIDKFIQKCQLEATTFSQILEWIPYEELADIKYLAEGGFSKVYKARWTKNDKLVALKVLNNSQNITSEFLSEIINHKLANRSSFSLVVRCYGISREPDIGNYILVTRYMSEGNLRQYLSKNCQQLKLENKLERLTNIVQGLTSIHQSDLVHQDFHSGNVLNGLDDNRILSFISDLGLSRPVNEDKQGKVYGVLPYVAPEVLCGQSHTQASDVYSFGIVAYEVLSGLPPYFERDYDNFLALTICKGLRPNLEEVWVPQLIKDLVNHCWSADPQQRPKASELFSILVSLLDNDKLIKKNTEFYYQYQALLPKIDSLPNKPLFNHSVDKYTSKLLNFKNLPKPQNSKEINEIFYKTDQISELLKNLPKTKETSSNLTKINGQIKEVETNIEELKKSLNSELAELVGKFVEVRKKLAKDKKNKEVKIEARNLGKQLEKKGLSEEKIEEIIRYCEDLVSLEQQLEQEQLQTNIEMPPKK